MTRVKTLKIIACGAVVVLAGCQYIKPAVAILSLFVGQRERVVYVEVEVPQVDKEPAETTESPATGR
jgi:hypothetical protein